MYSTHTGELDIPMLPLAARQCHIVPELASQSLISIGQLADANCIIRFDKTSVTVTLDGKTIMRGRRNPHGSKLWHVNMLHLNDTPQMTSTNSPTNYNDDEPFGLANAAIGGASPAEIVNFAHKALFSPTLSTLETALKKGFLHDIPGLTGDTLRRHPPNSIATAKGHLDQVRQNLRSTKEPPACTGTTAPVPPDKWTFPYPDDGHPRTHYCYAGIQDFTQMGQIYTDQTGRFIAPSSLGNNYILIIYDYDSNLIYGHALPSR